MAEAPGISLVDLQGDSTSVEAPGISLVDLQGNANQDDDSFFDSAVDLAGETVSTFADIGTGIGAGLIGLPQGIVETVTSGFDYIFDTDSTSEVTEFAESIKPQPTGTAGLVAEGLTTFGTALIPVIGWVGRASSVARGANTIPATSKFFKSAERFGASSTGQTFLGAKTAFGSRTKQALVTSFAGGAAEGLVAPDGTGTLADAFGVLPEILRTDRTQGLTGREKASQTLSNKFKIGTEGAAIGLGVEAAIPLAGSTIKVASMIPGVPQTARIISDGFQRIGEKVGNTTFGKYLSARGETPKELFENLKDVDAMISAQDNLAVKYLNEFESATKQTVGLMKLPGKRQTEIKRSYTDLMKYLEGDVKAFDVNIDGKPLYNNRIKQAAEKMRIQVDGLTDIVYKQLEDMVDQGLVEPSLIKPILMEMEKNKGAYIRRLYDGVVSLDAKGLAAIKTDARYIKSVENSAKGLMKIDAEKTLEQATAEATKAVDKAILGDLSEGSLSPEAILNLRKKGDKIGSSRVKEVPLYTISEGFFKKRSFFLDKNPQLRELMNEVRDPKVLFTSTISDLGKFAGTNMLYKRMAKATADGGFSETFETAIPKINNWLTKTKDANGKLIESSRPMIVSGKVINEKAVNNAYKDELRQYINKIFPSEDFKFPSNLKSEDELKLIQKAERIVDRNGGARSSFQIKEDVIKELTNSNRLYKKLDPQQIADLQAAGYKQLGKETPRKSSVIYDLEKEQVKAAESGKPFSKDQLKKNQKVKQEELDELSVSGGNYGALSGDYVAPEIFNALTIPTRTGGIGSELLALALQGKGLSQIAKTVLNPLAQVRNFLSGVFMVGANGNIARNMELTQSMSATFGKISNLSEPEYKQFYEMLGDIGIREENIVINEFQRNIKEGAGLTGAGKTGAAIEYGMNKLPIISTAFKGLQSVYGNVDTYWKTVGFVGEKAKFGSAFRKAGLDPDNLGDDIVEELVNSGLAPRSSDLIGKHGFINVFSGDIVKETMPIYSRVPEFIKSIRRVPVFGNFVAFPAEIVRNSSNILNRGLKELGFKASDSLIAKMGADKAAILERQIRAIGANRLASYVNMAIATPAGLTKAALLATDMSQEKLNEIRKLMPEFLNGHQTLPLNNPKDGKKFEYIDLTYMLPYDFVLAPARLALQTYSQKGQVGASEAEKILGGAWQAFKSLAEPFAGESLIAERVLDALPASYLGRGGQTPTGSPIWNEAEDFGTKVQKGFYHILGGLLPGGIEQFSKLTPRGFEQGRTYLAISGDPGSSGTKYDKTEEALTAFTGIRKLQLDIPKALSFSGYGYTQLRSSAIRGFGQVAKLNNSTKEEVLQAYVDGNNNLFRKQREMFEKIKAARAGGLSDKDIIYSLKEDSNLGTNELAMILKGQFSPIKPTKELYEAIYKESKIRLEKRALDKLPVPEMIDIYRGLIGRSLLSGGVQDPRETPSISMGDISSSSISMGDVNPSSINMKDLGVPNIKTGTKASTNTRTNPAFLGSNPIDILKNLTIGNRTQ